MKHLPANIFGVLDVMALPVASRVPKNKEAADKVEQFTAGQYTQVVAHHVAIVTKSKSIRG
jgi:hypothetical protein